MINLYLLNIREESKQRLEPRSNLRSLDLWGKYGQAICIGVNLHLIEKAQLEKLMKECKEIFS